MNEFPDGTAVSFNAEVHIDGASVDHRIEGVVVEQLPSGKVLVEFTDPATGSVLRQALLRREVTAVKP